MIEQCGICKSTILIVDDNPQNIQVVNSVLNKNGYKKVLFATSGEDALEIIDKKLPDLVLLDIMMPGIDGYDVCRKIKENEKTEDIPVIFLTAKSYNEDILRGLDAGAVDYITKPFDNEILLARVKTHLTIQYQTKLLEDANKFLEKKVSYEVSKRLQSNAKFYALYEQTSFGISFVDKNGNFIEANDRISNLLGYPKDELLKLNINELTYPEDREKNTKALNKVINYSKDYAELDKRCVKKDGTLIWFHTVFTRLKDKGNDNNFYLATLCQDITEQKKLQDELKSKEEMMIAQSRHAAMGNMIGMIAHQWKQPLSIIGMVVNNFKIDLELGEVEDDRYVKSFDEIESQVMYLSQTIDDFKNFFKPNKEKSFENVSTVMEHSLDLIGKSLQNNQIEILKKYETSTRINMFPNELMQVFINILNNSKDALLNNDITDPKIEIDIFEDENNVFVDIGDNAGGISDYAVEKIGTLYFTTKGESGTGLGIYMSKMIIEKQLEGELMWKNHNDGALFCISIPKSNT